MTTPMKDLARRQEELNAALERLKLSSKQRTSLFERQRADILAGSEARPSAVAAAASPETRKPFSVASSMEDAFFGSSSPVGYARSPVKTTESDSNSSSISSLPFKREDREESAKRVLAPPPSSSATKKEKTSSTHDAIVLLSSDEEEEEKNDDDDDSVVELLDSDAEEEQKRTTTDEKMTMRETPSATSSSEDGLVASFSAIFLATQERLHQRWIEFFKDPVPRKLNDVWRANLPSILLTQGSRRGGIDPAALREIQALIPKRPLSEEERRTVKRVFEGGPLSEKFVEHFSIDIKRSDLIKLAPRVWVNDEVVNCFIQLCQHRKNPGEYHCFASFFYNSLFADDNVYSFKKVARWTSRYQIDLFSKRLVLFPVNLSNVHWVFSFADMRRRRLVYLDSMGGAGEEVLGNLFRYLQEEYRARNPSDTGMTGFKTEVGFVDEDRRGGLTRHTHSQEWRLVSPGAIVPQQDNHCDCGVFACTFANLLLMSSQNGTLERIEEAAEDGDYGSGIAALFKSCFGCGDMIRIREQIILDILRGKVYPAT